MYLAAKEQEFENKSVRSKEACCLFIHLFTVTLGWEAELKPY